MSERVDIAILGAAGYGGQELLRLLAGHPRIRVAGAGSRGCAGRRVEDVLPHLAGFYPDLVFSAPEDAVPESCTGVFLATPHGASRALWLDLVARREDLRTVDLSADFRLRDPESFARVYGGDQAHLDRLDEFAYGLPETNRAEIAAKRHVANPGCFATGAILALAPFAAARVLSGDVVLAQTTGSSGSGADPKPGTHHPERVQDMRAYQVMRHRHAPEIAQELARLGAQDFDLAMIPQSGPFARGIFTAAHFRVPPGTDAAAILAEACAREPFLRLCDETPALRRVARTNFCDLSVAQEGERVVVLSAIDNLGKGMSGTAVQNMNLLLGFEEATGLWTPGANP